MKEGVDLIIMDDGFQSARLTLDYALVVIDTVRGIGNGHLVPGGPVRAPLAEQMRQMTGLLKVGKGHAADPLVRQAAKAAKPVFVAAITPQEPKISGASACWLLPVLPIPANSIARSRRSAGRSCRAAPSPIIIISAMMKLTIF